ncbi:iron complex transport system permease protein [Alkalispirochaeta americana]|uniref:Iron complex transport system permease protein n=1 Tax=Alkalispirochaeta americana TaxID=159291 RepID=A0A1N6S4P7_9SPIO|nr:iron ABC transporter permease [Alkalispirochaeta americana]SIQ36065.1 iron complex transport system permease protein [Alkalispirochaeta americana]
MRRSVSGVTALLLPATVLFLAAGAALALGSVPLSPAELLAALRAGPLADGGDAAFALERIILFQVRLPRVGAAAGAGASLGLAGLLMQTVFRNPLAGPGVLGVSAGAGLGVALVVLAGAGAHFAAPTVAAAALGSALVISLMMLVHRMVGQPVVVLVLGLLFGYAASALTAVLMAASPAQGLEQYIHWSFGSFALPPGWKPLALLAAALGTTVLLTILAAPIDVLLLGSAYAESSGIHAHRLQGVLLLCAGLLTALVTALTGPISFLGVAVPHLARGHLRTSRHRLLLPGVALWGAAIAIVADLLSRLPGSDRLLPLNAVLSVVGVPVVLLTILRPSREGTGPGVEL